MIQRVKKYALGQRMTLTSPVTDPNWRDRLSIGVKHMVLTFQVVQFDNRAFKVKRIAISGKEIITLVLPSVK